MKVVHPGLMIFDGTRATLSGWGFDPEGEQLPPEGPELSRMLTACAMLHIARVHGVELIPAPEQFGMDSERVAAKLLDALRK